MSKANGSGNPDTNGKANEMDFEFIDETEIVSVKRGRKTVVIAEMVEFLSKAKVGQSVKLNGFALDSALDAETKRKAKATNSATIRNQAKIAGWAKVAIIWDVTGFPVAKRIA